MKFKLDDKEKDHVIFYLMMGVIALMIVVSVQAIMFTWQEHNTTNLVKSSFTLMIDNIKHYDCNELNSFIQDSKIDKVEQGEYAKTLNELAQSKFEEKC